MLDLSYFEKKNRFNDRDFTQKKVLLRVDLNVPLDGEKVLDDLRIRESLPTIKSLLEQDAKVILVSHFKRPKGREKDKSLYPVSLRLQELLGQEVFFLESPIGSEDLKKEVDAVKNGQVILLENIRFYEEETKNDEKFSKDLASLADVFVNDAFGTMHRSHSSTQGVTAFLPSAMGLLPEKELHYIETLVKNASKPVTVILGGGKTSSKIKLLKGLMEFADNILIGGGMSFTFLKALGFQIGNSLFEEDTLPLAKEILEESKKSQVKLYFPLDIVCAKEVKAGAETITVQMNEGIPEGMIGLDIGPNTVEVYRNLIKESKTLFWNGPVGVFELPPFDFGTKNMAHAIESITSHKDVLTLIGGGESALASKMYGIEDKVSHISTGGGALLELLEGSKLPGLVSLTDKS